MCVRRELLGICDEGFQTFMRPQSQIYLFKIVVKLLAAGQRLTLLSLSVCSGLHVHRPVGDGGDQREHVGGTSLPPQALHEVGTWMSNRVVDEVSTGVVDEVGTWMSTGVVDEVSTGVGT